MPKQQLDVGMQIFWMRRFFPQFKYSRKKWKGVLQPRESSPKYKVRIDFRGPKSPKVWVLDPPIDPRAPHRYSDGSLCLFYDPDQNWKQDSIIANTIVPWTAAWLFFYEYWQETRKWFGEEAPHEGPKKSD